MSATKKITIIAFVAALGGILAELLAVAISFPIEQFGFIHILQQVFSSVKLSYLNNFLFVYYSFDTNLEMNFLNLGFYTLLLVGAVSYLKSRKEVRLLRFAFAIIFLVNILRFIEGVIEISNFPFANIPWIMVLFMNLKFIAWTWLSYYSLKELNKSRSLNRFKEEADGSELTHYVPASKWQRFFHVSIDTVICFLIFSELSLSFGFDFLRNIDNSLGIFTIILISRIIYYPFFETLFGATPAKFLSETRVVTNSLCKPDFNTILLRTVSRFVPFEAFSFFDKGWHDTWSKTSVLQEKREGVKGTRYFLLLPSFLILGIGIYFGNEQYEQYQAYQYRKQEHEYNILELESKLKTLSSSDFIKLKNIRNPYELRTTYLKVEADKGKEIQASIIDLKDVYEMQFSDLETYYSESKDRLKKITLNKDILFQAFTRDYDMAYNDSRPGVKLLDDEREFEIADIQKLFQPIIASDKTGMMGNDYISLTFVNYGWPANLVEIKNTNGEINWQTKLPQYLKTGNRYGAGRFSLYGSNYRKNEEYEFIMTLEDTLQRIHKYEVKGVNIKARVKKID